MINKDNFKELLKVLNFEENGDFFTKYYSDNSNAYLKVDFFLKKLIYPIDKGFVVNGEFTTNFLSDENFVVFECVNRLFEKGYKPEHIELEPKWKIGHGASGGRADILIKDNSDKAFLIIECKTDGYEFKKEWDNTKFNGGQLFSYAKQVGSTQYLCLYSSDLTHIKVEYKSYIISLNDNKNLLESLIDKKPMSFSQAKSLSVEDIFNAWKYTYDLYYDTKGIFENEIEPYKVGKLKHKLHDLKEIGSKDIQTKYHEFASIMRRFNVSGRENAFDKLVNLFLCKVVDEYENPEDLKFYWKGIANDSYFELQDRLQMLYQIGMDKFLEEKITNVNRSEIVEAFRFVKKDPDSTQETILKFFRQLKYFKNSDFSFIDVHNEGLFYQNSIILLEVVKMLQDIRLTSETQNQFLGDMFEGFLDNGVKQSEGQFFTPMPIVKFIIKSLPIIDVINECELPPKAIDYACGAGHFLNELALEMKNYVKDNNDIKIEEYYKNITGIEKEYRLSKVAKVSAFMYGQDDIKITYADALGKNSKTENNDYSILVANPPYSVKGFLQTLSEEERKNYYLTNIIETKSLANNNSIETFFIERAKQLLKPGGVAGIILPVSILTNDSNIYMKTREIILKFFDIISIVEFGSETFGKTGTNTIALFLKRKKDNPSPSEHWKYRIDSWFGNNETEKTYEDKYKIIEYCEHIGLKFSDYKTLLINNPNSDLLNSEIFLEYKKTFYNLSDIKKYTKNKVSYQFEIELKSRFIKYVQEIEKDKLYYFVLASENNNKILVVKYGSTTKEQREFLGYKWSSAKGNEGIKYINQNVVSDEINDEESKEILEKLYGLQSINTPLYNPQNSNDKSKINKYILENFRGNYLEIPDNLMPYITYCSLTDMLDFNRKDFNKQISLTNGKKDVIESKWPIVKLGDYVYIKIGGTPSRDNSTFYNGDNLWVSISEMKGQVIYDTKEKITDEGVKKSNVKLIPKGTTLLSFKLSIGKTAIAGKDLYTNEAIAGLIPIDNNIISNEYLNQIFAEKIIDLESNTFKAFGKSLNSDYLREEVKIPLPPIDVQNQISSLCLEIDNKIESLISDIESFKIQIDNYFKQLDSKVNKKIKLSDENLFDVFIGRRVLAKDISNSNLNGIPVYSANVFQPFGYINKEFISDFSSSSILWGIDGDWMVNTILPNNSFYPTDHCGVIRIKTNEVNFKYLAWALYKVGKENRFSRSNRASTDRIKGLVIPVPPIDYQLEIIPEIEKLELKIEENKQNIETISASKKNIILKYL